MRADDYIRIEKALDFMGRHQADQPDLEAMAASVNLSKYHFQRLFTRWAGISPGRFLQCLTLNHAQTLLHGEASVLDTALDVGLSGPGRLHDLFVTHEAVTPGEFKSGGEALRISHGIHPSPFGDCLLALTARGICGLAFVAEEDKESALEDMMRRWPEADWVHDLKTTGATMERIFAPEPRAAHGASKPLHLLLRGTNFQVRVWKALLNIPPGQVARYGDVAGAIGSPKAQRAVGQAVGANPVAFLIPCHRVIRGTGALGGYRWGKERKRRLLAWETGRFAQERAGLLEDSGFDGAGIGDSGIEKSGAALL